MIYCCCLCAPDKIREGRIRAGYGVPLCAEHHSRVVWRAREPESPRVVTWPPSPEEAYQNASALAAFAGAMVAG
jgi:hypothetical protein